ncbi:MAG TPA: hypothetical protein VEZ19_15645 [Rubrobacter sp.]|jgi:MutL C terminal dimerisation domain|nr:hypothetical protein [Rubrobacter sp.]
MERDGGQSGAFGRRLEADVGDARVAGRADVALTTLPATMLSLSRILSPVSTPQGKARRPKGNRTSGRRPSDNQEGDGLIILDQHGAHERILYERLRENPEAAPATLESPATAILPENLAPELWAFEEDLGSLGFLFESFGPDAVRVTAAPETAVDPEAAFLAALQAMAGGENLAKALACKKGSTKFGENLSGEGVAAMLDEWSCCEFPKTCPPN